MTALIPLMLSELLPGCFCDLLAVCTRLGHIPLDVAGWLPGTEVYCSSYAVTPLTAHCKEDESCVQIWPLASVMAGRCKGEDG